MIKTFDELNQMRDKCASCLSAKFTGKDNQRHVVLCGGTGCISSRSNEIADELNRLIKEHGLENKVAVNGVPNKPEKTALIPLIVRIFLSLPSIRKTFAINAAQPPPS